MRIIGLHVYIISVVNVQSVMEFVDYITVPYIEFIICQYCIKNFKHTTTRHTHTLTQLWCTHV